MFPHSKTGEGLMSQRKPDLFSDEVHERVLERIGKLTRAEWEAMINWRPEGVPEDWPSLMEPPPGCEVPSRNGGVRGGEPQ